jgi:hypothetical protein
MQPETILAPDTIETNSISPGADVLEHLEAATGEPISSLPRSLFQIVCLQDARQNPQPTTASL